MRVTWLTLIPVVLIIVFTGGEGYNENEARTVAFPLASMPLMEDRIKFGEQMQNCMSLALKDFGNQSEKYFFQRQLLCTEFQDPCGLTFGYSRRTLTGFFSIAGTVCPNGTTNAGDCPMLGHEAIGSLGQRKFRNFGMVDNYFYQVFRTVYLKSMAKMMADENIENIHVTGHSLGGGVATLIALSLLDFFPSENITLTTFGSPRVGDDVFATSISKLRYNRITFRHDPVPSFPKVDYGKKVYKHGGTEIYYRCGLDGKYDVCTTNTSSCVEGIGISQYNATNHLQYFSEPRSLADYGRSGCTLKLTEPSENACPPGN